MLEQLFVEWISHLVYRITRLDKRYDSTLVTMTIWATSWENVFMPHANNKGADPPAHPCSLISAFVVCCLNSVIPLVAISESSSFYLASVAGCTGRFESTLIANPEARFSRDEAHLSNNPCEFECKHDISLVCPVSEKPVGGFRSTLMHHWYHGKKVRFVSFKRYTL